MWFYYVSIGYEYKSTADLAEFDVADPLVAFDGHSNRDSTSNRLSVTQALT